MRDGTERVGRFRVLVSRLTGGSEQRAGVMFVIPVVIAFLLMRIIPSVVGAYYSFTTYSVFQSGHFVGLANYAALTHDSLFWQAFKNTAIYTVGVTVPLVVFSLAFALALNQRIRGLAVLRTIYYLPVVASFIAVSSAWVYIMNPTFGVLNYLLGLVGVPELGWLNSVSMALPSVIVIGIWKQLGFGIIIYLASLQGIPPELHEAAAVDGLGPVQRFRRITVPLLIPTSVLLALLTIITSFQAFDQIYALTGGGPANATTTVVYYIYQNAFVYFKMGYASAMAILVFVTIFVGSMLLLRATSRREIRY
jgi:multiple sugar transport system permease protein